MQNGKNYHKHSDSKPQTQLAIEKFADMMIARMDEGESLEKGLD